MASIEDQVTLGSGPKNYKWYQTLKKPPVTPPQWVFPVVWTTLYIMIGVSGYLYISKTGLVFTPGLFFYCFQIFLNVIWSPLFFWKKLITLALIDLILLWISVLVTIILFHPTSPLAAYLLIPYICWLCLAGYLNAYIVVMNPEHSEFKKEQQQLLEY